MKMINMSSVKHYKFREVKIEVLTTHCLILLNYILEASIHTMSLKISVLIYQCFNVLPIEVVLMIVIFLQLVCAHEPQSPNVIWA
jgi:hypothetical protein